MFYDLKVSVSPSDSSLSGSNRIRYKVLEETGNMEDKTPERSKKAPGSRMDVPSPMIKAPGSRMDVPTPMTKAPGSMIDVPTPMIKAPGSTMKVLNSAIEMQIDLMAPLQLDSVVQEGRQLTYRRDGDAYFIQMAAPQNKEEEKEIYLYYHGRPRVARNAPWDGGIVWGRDSLGRRWVASACQGLGASVWWPCKDLQADEPDSQRITLTVPQDMIAVSNGRLEQEKQEGGLATYIWMVRNPINNYNVALNAGSYVHFGDTYAGEDGRLSLDYWPLDYNLKKAEKQFEQVKSMLNCFEHWFGPYPWYKDGYKLVETPHLGMEHQSCIAYGNRYMNGYLGSDLSHTGWGLKWDFIIVHESGHEWFGNNITTKDIADMWVHEAFTTYSEALYVECLFGKEAGAQYARGMMWNIKNDRPVTGHYGVHEEGSGDMYNKGAGMLHTIRQIINDDTKWRNLLRGLGETFRHQTVTGARIQEYISAQSGIDFTRVFQQYLTTTQIPLLEYKIAGNRLSYRWRQVVEGFDMPVRVYRADGSPVLIYPSASWKTLDNFRLQRKQLKVDDNFFIRTKKSPV